VPVPVAVVVVEEASTSASIGIFSTFPSTYPTVTSARFALLGRMETVTLTLSDGEPLIVGLGWEVVFLGVERRERRRRGEREVEGWKGFRAA
jgi:hypothetical protein